MVKRDPWCNAVMLTAGGFANLKFAEAETTGNQEETEGFVPRSVSPRGEEMRADAEVNKK